MITQINVTPLVDIMLVLLIIFMVTTSYIVRDSLDVSLPEARSGEPQKVTLLAITLDKDGTLALNGGSDVGRRPFVGLSTNRQAGGTPIEAVIAADKRVSHGEVVRVIDLVRSAGVVRFAINVLNPGAVTCSAGCLCLCP